MSALEILFMAILKAARATAGGHNPDDYEDGAAYFALAGEAAARGHSQVRADNAGYSAGV